MNLPAEWINQDLRNELKQREVDHSYTMWDYCSIGYQPLIMYLSCQPLTIYMIHNNRPDVEFTKYESKDRIWNLKDAHSNGLTDALMADFPDSGCTLIITEGPSAKEFAVRL